MENTEKRKITDIRLTQKVMKPGHIKNHNDFDQNVVIGECKVLYEGEKDKAIYLSFFALKNRRKRLCTCPNHQNMTYY